jgi:hypothetical protein
LARNLDTLFMFMLCPTCLTKHPERDPARTSLPHTSTNNYKKSKISLAHFTPGESLDPPNLTYTASSKLS